MKKMIELTPKQASEKIQQNNQVLFLDVRSCVEYKFVGHAVGSILQRIVREVIICYFTHVFQVKHD
jgi:hypothetical protein